MDPIRLNKYLVDAGVCSRREADRLMGKGKIKVNGKPATLGMKVNGTESIIVYGKPVTPPSQKKRVYLAYHKPIGVICTSDPEAADNIIEAVNFPERVFHIGRLDVASSGLILLTNDGDIVNKVLRSEGKHDKEYVVTVHRTIDDADLKRMASGLMLDGRKTLPAQVSRLGDTSFAITIVEGRNRQIRRMCEMLKYEVKRLERIRIMHVELGNLPVGQWRHLTPDEEKKFIQDLA